MRLRILSGALWGNIQEGNDKIALLIDDLAPGGGWRPRDLRVDGTVELVKRPSGSGTLVMKIGQVVGQLLARRKPVIALLRPGSKQAFRHTRTTSVPRSLPDDANAKAI